MASDPALSAKGAAAQRRGVPSKQPGTAAACAVLVLVRWGVGIGSEVVLDVGRIDGRFHLTPAWALVAATTWLGLLSGLLWFVVIAYRPPLRWAFRRIGVWESAILIGAAWPLAWVHVVEAGVWRRYWPRWLWTGDAPLGASGLLEAFADASALLSVAGLTCVVMLAVVQVIVFLALNITPPAVEESRTLKEALSSGVPFITIRGTRGAGGPPQKLAVGLPVGLLVLYLMFDCVGFPVSTSVALMGAYALTGTIVAPSVLAAAVCVFLWI